MRAGLRPTFADGRGTLARVSTDPKDRWRDLGSFIREQRASARLSLRRLSELAGISNPYLSQIERGLRRPSAEILQQIAKALRMVRKPRNSEAKIACCAKSVVMMG